MSRSGFSSDTPGFDSDFRPSLTCHTLVLKIGSLVFCTPDQNGDTD